MQLIDMHCDTIWRLKKMETGYGNIKPHIETLYDNTGHLDIAGMKEAGTLTQFFANFIYLEDYEHDWEKAYAGALKLIARAKKELIGAFEDMQLLTSFGELKNLKKSRFSDSIIDSTNSGNSTTAQISAHKIGAFLTIEEGGILNSKMERLHHLYNEGIRLMTLTWNYENCIGHPASDDAVFTKKGLKPFGFEVLEEMNRLGMMIDVSHLSDGGFWDVISHSKNPIVASHSNARSLCNVRRNLNDDMLKALGENGGISGVNFFPYFVAQRNSHLEPSMNFSSRYASQSQAVQVSSGHISQAQAAHASSGHITQAQTVQLAQKIEPEDIFCHADDLAAHIAHMIQVGGEDLPAVGTDFDGYNQGKSEINHVSQMDLFYDALAKKGLSERQIDKVCWGNAMRVIEANL